MAMQAMLLVPSFLLSNRSILGGDEMQCPKCDTAVPDGLQICFQCGARLTASGAYIQQPSGAIKARKKKMILPTMICLVVLCAVGLTIWMTDFYERIPFPNRVVHIDLPTGIETAQPNPANLPVFVLSEQGEQSAVDGGQPADKGGPSDDALAIEGFRNAEFRNDSREWDWAHNGLEVRSGIIGFVLKFEQDWAGEVQLSDFSDFVLTKDGAEIPVPFGKEVTVKNFGNRYEVTLGFEPPLSEPGTYILTFKLFGTPVTVNDNNVVSAGAEAEAKSFEESSGSWSAMRAYSDFLDAQGFTTREYLHYSDRAMFPVHEIGGQEYAVMQADFYKVSGFDYPVMVLVEFQPMKDRPDALDTFPLEVAYVIGEGGVVTSNKSTAQTAALYTENAESGMTFINGDLISSLTLAQWAGKPPVEDSLQALYDWLARQ